jgi:hypothetical protein
MKFLKWAHVLTTHLSAWQERKKLNKNTRVLLTHVLLNWTMTSVSQEIASMQKAIERLQGKCEDLAKDCIIKK